MLFGFWSHGGSVLLHGLQQLLEPLLVLLYMLFHHRPHRGVGLCPLLSQGQCPLQVRFVVGQRPLQPAGLTFFESQAGLFQPFLGQFQAQSDFFLIGSQAHLRLFDHQFHRVQGIARQRVGRSVHHATSAQQSDYRKYQRPEHRPPPVGLEWGRAFARAPTQTKDGRFRYNFWPSRPGNHFPGFPGQFLPRVGHQPPPGGSAKGRVRPRGFLRLNPQGRAQQGFQIFP